MIRDIVVPHANYEGAVGSPIIGEVERIRSSVQYARGTFTYYELCLTITGELYQNFKSVEPFFWAK